MTRCMQEGSVLILTEVDTVALAGNRGLMDVLQCRRRLHKTTSSQKITVSLLMAVCLEMPLCQRGFHFSDR